MNIYQYLQKIEAGKAVNAIKFGRLLENEGLKLTDLGPLKHIKLDNYTVSNINRDTLHTWLVRFSAPTSRVDASRRMLDSHKHRTSSSYFIGKKLDGLHEDIVIKCTDSLLTIGNSTQLDIKELVLIENSDCYSASDRFLSNMGFIQDLSRYLAIWSSGNSITHPNAIRFLGQFEKIHYCPDYDLAGLEIYETLHKKLGEKIIFAMPNNLIEYKAFCKKPIDQKHYVSALEKATKLNFQPMVALLTEGMGVLEQEVIIGEHYEK